MTRPTVIPRDVVLDGRIDGEGDVIVLGRVEGPVAVEGLVVIEEGGAVHGDVRARSLTVRGALVGHGTATEGLWIDATGSVVGDLRARRVRIAGGARFRGRTYVEGVEAEPSAMTSPPPDLRISAVPAPPPASPRAAPASFAPHAREASVWPELAPPFPELRRIHGRARPV